MAKIRRMPFFEVVSTPQSKPRVTLPMNRPQQAPATGQGESGQLAGQQTHTPQTAAESQTSPSTTGETRPPQIQTQPSSSQPSQSHTTPGDIRNIRSMKETEESTQSVIQEAISGSEEAGADSDEKAEQEISAVDEPERQARVNGDRVVSVSTNTILIWVAVMVVLCVGFYMLGVNQGQRMERTLPPDSQIKPEETPINPPLPTEDPLMGSNRAGNQTGEKRGVPEKTVTKLEPQQGLTGGVLGSDPRQTGNNYLLLAQLNFRDAEDAVQFLGRNGLRAAAVPLSLVRAGKNGTVDLVKARANNDLCVVFLLDGFPSAEYSARSAEREGLEREVRRLGQIWQKQHSGASDFSSPSWSKFKD